MARAWFYVLPACLRADSRAEEGGVSGEGGEPSQRVAQPLVAPLATLPAPGEWRWGWAAGRWVPVSSVLPALLPGWAWLWGRAVAPSFGPPQPRSGPPVCVGWTG